MNWRSFLIATASIVAILLPVAISGRRMATAESYLVNANLALGDTARDVQEIVDLRGREERIGLAERPTQDVIAQVNAVLAEVGLPTQRLKSLSPESDVAVNWGSDHPGAGPGARAATQYRRQSLRLVLEDLSVQEVGSFLAAWKKSPGGTIWTPNRIELTHSRSGGGGGGKGDNNRYDLTVLITAIYVSQIREAS